MEQILLFSKQFSTVLFFTFFTGVFIWTYIINNKNQIEDIRYSIFDKEELGRMNKNG